MKVNKREFNCRSEKCPMCGKGFRSGDCKHSVVQVEKWIQDDYMKRLCREQVRKQLAKANKLLV